MQIELMRATVADAQELWKMQKEGFAELLERYQDVDTNPACERLEKVVMRLEQPETVMYFILADGQKVGAVRVRDVGDGWKKLGPLWVMPAWRGQGVAQQAICLVEDIHGADKWMLDTILQEAGNCHLYEKMGYRQTGAPHVVNERMTLVDYVKEKK
ncbi:MAG: GNAT family N-acetyltransferase [Clostridia bacterium]|nr:GNAT family N-acetyltransferase [Clostridia bacterium]